MALRKVRARAPRLSPGERTAWPTTRWSASSIQMTMVGAPGFIVVLVGVRGRGRVEGGPQDAQCHPVGIDRQRRVQVQAAGYGMVPSPCVWLRRVKFRRAPSCMHSTVSCARIRRSVRSRWGSRMLSTVTAPPAGWSISR